MSQRHLFLRLATVTRRDRHLATDQVADAVGAAGGWIDGHNQFSNKMTTLRFTLPAGGLVPLRSRLADLNLALTDEAAAALDATIAAGHAPDREVSASFQLTFIHDEPDLRIDIPAVPG
ncbi:hypothetical protein [Tistrella mobilis]|uniref:Uncharacterized protein n=1 Tax=Tistrella mobilis (strain KA081020-065) TaxID=1110502 RepID=I3TXA1_TISMK|nr:hypothetical protein [Tistrella mobilis]AFK57389.1 hypothetical protein TMO_c0779 [Tistrella mobilis KA081020-065]